MRARRTHDSNHVLVLPGGTEDNDLWIEVTADNDQSPLLCSVWEPTKREREEIAEGKNVELILWGTRHPPVAMQVTDVKLGKVPSG